MIRRAAAVILALMLNPALARAQDTVLSVSVPSADVHLGPSTATPIIGHVSRGTALPVARNLGSWVRVAWPDAPDGVGYVHVTMGRLGAPEPAPQPANASQAAATSARMNVAQPTATPSASATGAVAQTPPRTAPRAQGDPRIVTGTPSNTTPAIHGLGVGGVIGSTHTFGATTRVWTSNRLAIQFGFSRESMLSDVAAGTMTTVQFEPGVVYGIVDHVSDYVWVRPYLGSVLTFGHQSLNNTSPALTEPVTDTAVGYRIFGGSEFMFASAPRFGVSADVGYRRLPTSFAGFESNALSVSIAGHWYVR
jgi:hypothetical protein